MSDLLTREELEAIAARANAATPGPWKDEPGEFGRIANIVTAPGTDLLVSHLFYKNDDNDLAFIARARTDVPRLLSHIRALEAECAVARAHIEHRNGLIEAWKQIAGAEAGE